MTELSFTVTGARPAPSSAGPAILFRMRVERAGGERVHAIALRCQIRIDARRRRYTADEQACLYELFGAPAQWERNLQGVTWALTSSVIPSFDGSSEFDLPLPCTYDLEVASAKFLHGVRSGDVPLTFLFSGTVFTVADGAFSVEPIPWDLEASYRMPASVWRETVDRFFPGGGWLRLDRETIDRLQAFRGAQALVSWDAAIARLLDTAAAEQPA
jgi:hypothetical protein